MGVAARLGQVKVRCQHAVRRALGFGAWLYRRAKVVGIAARGRPPRVDSIPGRAGQPRRTADDLATRARERKRARVIGGLVRINGRLRVARLLSAVLVILMIGASVAGLRVSDLYREPLSVAAMLRGYDLVALVIAVPLLVASLTPALRESPRGQLLWASMLTYCAYNYAIYVFGTAFNAALLLHVALFSLSVYALALALAGVDVADIAHRVRNRTPVRLIGAVLAFLAAGLGGMWVFYSLRFAVTGAPPGESLLVLPAAGVHLGYVLDLALLVPAYAVAAVLLWRRAAWGYVLAGVLLPFTVVYQLNYLTALIFQTWNKVPGAVVFDPQEVPIIAAAAAAAVLLFRNLADNEVKVA
jgi:hypothetical protein